MILAHRIQLDPTAKQRIYFAKAAGTARLVWNWSLAEWNEQYAAGGKPKAPELKRYFNSAKYDLYPWLSEIHRDAHAQPFANLQTAFNNFFAGRARRPTFKKKGKSRDSFYCACDKLSVDDDRVRLPVVGSVRMTEALRFDGKIQSAVVSRDADRWFISIQVEMPDPKPAKPSGESIGIDLGLTTFAALSNGEKIEAPKPLAASIKRLRRLSRRHSRKVKGSNNRRKAAMKLARHHRRVRNIRQDFLHQTSTRLSKNHAAVCVEDLNVSGMVKNRCLSRAISDASWSEFRRLLDYKCPLYGSTLTVRARFFASSKTCSDCGHKVDSLPLSVREWVCPSCGSLHDRDTNAGKNLLSGTVPSARRELTPVEIAALTLGNQRETAVGDTGTTTVRTHVRSHRR